MTTATQANVTKLYIATFDRAPDGPGLNYWVNSGMSLEAIAQSFFDQPETQTKYAGVSLQTFIETVYRNVLGRDGEAAGIAYWKGQLESNKLTRDQVIIAVVNGAQGTDATLLENKTQVGMHYAKFGDGTPNEFQVIRETKLDLGSVEKVIDWIDGKIPAQHTPSTYFVLNDNRTGYDLKGSTKDDVFVVEAFKSANIHGGDGSDTLDFQDFSSKGVSVNLSTGLGPNGAGGTAMKFEWIENIRGTAGNDTLIGNSDANILVAMGGVDVVDGGVGNDRILFRTVADVTASTINGGQNTDTLEITNQTEISVGAASFTNVSDVEILQVGYSAEGVAAATTITVAGGTPLNTFKEIRGTESYDKKGAPTNDVIQSALNLDVSGVKLTSIEELKMTAAENAAQTAGKITIGKDTLTSVKVVAGHEASKTTDLILNAKAGDVFDLTVPTFTNIDRVAQLPVAGPGVAIPGVASTVIVNQSLINSLANADGADGFGTALALAGDTDAGTAGGFTQSTLRASGIGLDLSALRDGDTNFKSIEFGTAREVTIGNINNGAPASDDLTDLRSIVGSVNDADLLRVLPDAVGAQNLTGISITKVERLDFEETSTVALVNTNLTDVRQISGDNDRVGIVNDAGDTNDNGTVIDAGFETEVGGLNLKGKTLQDIVGFGNNVSGSAGTVTVNSQTVGLGGIRSLDNDSIQTIIADDAGAYDFSKVATAEAGSVDFDRAGTGVLNDSSTWVETRDLFVGSAGNDTVKGGQASFSYDLGAGNDTFIGSNTANELVLGGDGNDTISLGDNTAIDGAGNPIFVVNNAGILINAANSGFGADYVALANDVLTPPPPPPALDTTHWGDLTAYVDGGAGDDMITSGKAAVNGDGEMLIGGTGHDSIVAGDGDDVLVGGEGHDILSGGKGADYMIGGEGDDVLEGNAGEDFLFGGKGRDVLRGDELKAGTQIIDHLDRDHFIFEAGDSGTIASTVDIIKDFLSISINNSPISDVIYHNWFAADDSAALGSVVSGATTYAPAAVLTTVDNTVGAVPGEDGQAYTTITADVGNAFTGEASLLAAANKALDRAYKDFVFGQLDNTVDEYVSQAVQFEYGGREYLVIDAFVTGAAFATVADGQAANNFNVTQDLLIQIADAPVSWSVNADDIVVTRWDPII